MVAGRRVSWSVIAAVLCVVYGVFWGGIRDDRRRRRCEGDEEWVSKISSRRNRRVKDWNASINESLGGHENGATSIR